MPLLELLFACVGVALPQESWPPAPAFERPAEEVGELPASVSVTPLGAGRFRARFFLDSTVRAERVDLAGSFNGWRVGETPLRRGADGRWSAEVELDGGRHLYKFVLDGGRWIPDPRNSAREDDGHGGENTVLALGVEGHLAGGGALTGAARLFAYRHDPAQAVYLQRAGDGRALVRYRAPLGAARAPRLVLRAQPPVEMGLAGELGGYALYEALVALPDEPRAYTFLVDVDGAERSDPAEWRLDAAALPDFATPDWAKHATWYQIFPDRFRNGDAANDPPDTRAWTSEWYTPSPDEERDGRTLWRWSIFKRFYGGDLAGVEQELDYLQGLGVTALYFNPIFEAESNHRYEATDYRHVDTALGAGEDWAEVAAREDLRDPSTWTWSPSDRVFLRFLAAAHARGMHVILDGVWNHVGTRHPAFADVREHGAASPYRDWFDVTSFEPFQYNGWAGFGDLPAFKKSSEGFACAEVERHVFAVTRRWMDPNGDGDPSDGIDGWRLDVPMEVAMPFWERWRRHVKSIDPDAYLVGEVWDRADAWLDGTRFDAVMNYRFADAAVAWIGNRARKLSASALDRRLAELRLAYPLEATQCLMNLADSHDTDRLVSMFANPDRGYDEGNREQDDAHYDGAKPDALCYRRARLFALLQMTYVGAPMVYYGDEAGMWGPDDPSCRKPMLWEDLEPYAKPRENHVERDHLAWYRAAGALRRAHPALRTGEFATLAADDAQDLFVFLRRDAHEELVVALNAGDAPARFALPEGAPWTAVFGEGAHNGRAKVPPVNGVVWVRAR
ncbi:MAG: DUF3459 domain-containing protein [Planctomycetes bacterium]|nr:DUF3459 domain-containing protein [Planctomycetota bacterium]